MKQLFTVLLLVMTGLEVRAQDPEFSQFNANPLYLNPAMAGTAIGPRFAMNFRDQWPSVSGNFVTYSASYDEHFDAVEGGVGAQVLQDRAGDGRLSTTSISGFYSYHLTVKSKTRNYCIVKAGLQAGAFQRSVDFSKFRFGDQVSSKLGFIYPTAEHIPSEGIATTGMIPDFSAGVLVLSNRMYAGLAVHHITQPSQSFYGNPLSMLPRKYTAHFGMTLPIDRWKTKPETYFLPNILIQRQGKFTQMNLGASVSKGYIVGGISYRHTDPNADALIFTAGFKKDAVRIGYSYDLTVSDARAAAMGSHEISVIVELQKYARQTKKKWKGLECPKFN